MGATDPLADVLTKIRNGSNAKHATVDVPASKVAERVLALLKDEGFIRNVKPMGEGVHRSLRVYLKYGPDKVPAIGQIRRISRPGQRAYADLDRMPRVLNGLGRAIMSTSKGVMTDQKARREHVGGEVLCYVW
jgi:small subunit ribosomal protein S8